MEAFQSLIQLQLSLIAINIVLSGVLWRATRYRPFSTLTLHWIVAALNFFVAGALASQAPIVRLSASAIPTFFQSYLLALILGQMLNIKMPLQKFIWAPVIGLIGVFALHSLGLGPEAIAIPGLIAVGSPLIYVAFQALRHYRQELTFSQWAIVIVYIAYAIHFLDFAYFYVRFQLLTIGFTIALAFHYFVSILIPTALLEKVAQERARLETELKYQAQLIQTAKMAALGEMAGGVAHEINTPLAIATLLLDQIKELAPDTQRPHAIEQIAQKCQGTLMRISKITKGLLTFSKEESNTHFVEFNLQAVIEDTLILCQERIKNRKASLELEIPSHPISLYGHPSQISQVLLNLLNNAVDAIEEVPVKQIVLSVENLENQVAISISDTGPKIPGPIRDKLFQPFFTTKEIGKGTGLGLSVSKGIIETHGGKIFLDPSSKLTRFTILLPTRTEKVEPSRT